MEISADSFWRTPFQALSNPRMLKEYVIMDIDKDRACKPHVFGKESHKHQLGDAWVIKSSELTTTSQQVHTKTHLAHLLNVGDSVLGFDMANANINDENVDNIKEEKLPDVVRPAMNKKNFRSFRFDDKLVSNFVLLNKGFSEKALRRSPEAS